MTEMTREDIIRMAREADLVYWKPNSTFSDGVWWMDAGELGDEIELFAALIAAAAKAEEREAIAQIIEDAPPLVDYAINERGGCLVCGFAPKLASEFIRTRGETK